MQHTISTSASPQLPGINIMLEHLRSRSDHEFMAFEIPDVEQLFRYKKLRRHQYLFQEGDVCRFMAFIISGSIRMFSVSKKGVEHTMAFGMENSWVCDYESFNMLTPSKYNFQVLEETELLLISCDQLQQLSRQCPLLDQVMRKEETLHLIAAQKRLHAAISQTAEERYLDLIESTPGISGRFTLAMIASYLGVAPETLSRIRKNRIIESRERNKLAE